MNYTYEFMDQLTVIKKNGAVQSKYWYDAHGRRVRLWNTQDGYINYVYQGWNVIFENDTQGVATKHFYANGLHIAENRSGTIEYYHQDHLGSTRLKTNNTGGVVFSSNYQPFGLTYDETCTEEFKYTGEYEDTSGLYYFGARYYDPNVGRFITEDPKRGKLKAPQTLNRYVYCNNNPLKYVDLDGRVADIIIAAGVGFYNLGVYLGECALRWKVFSWQDALWEFGVGFIGGYIVTKMPHIGLFTEAWLRANKQVILYTLEKLWRGEPIDAAELAERLVQNEIISQIFISFVKNPILAYFARNIVGKAIDTIQRFHQDYMTSEREKWRRIIYLWSEPRDMGVRRWCELNESNPYPI